METRKRLLTAWQVVRRPTISAAVGGYAVVALFGAVYGLLSLVSPSLSSTAKVTIATLVAAPVALGILWPRLTGFQLFGLGVVLSQSAVEPDLDLANVVSAELGEAMIGDQYFSGRGDLLQEIERAITQPQSELVEVNLQDGNYWWQTRLYLLAALVDDFAPVAQFVFVRDGAKRSFVGLAPAAAVRVAIAAEFPSLEYVYLKARQRQAGMPPPRVGEIVTAWATNVFDRNPLDTRRDFATETDLVVMVTETLLRAWLAKLDYDFGLAQSITWSGFSTLEVVRAVVRDFDGTYVALLRGDRLDRVVNRVAVAERLAEQSLG